MKQRLISALIALLIFIPLFILGGIYFKIGLVLVSLLITREILNLKNNLPMIVKIITYLLTSVLLIFDINITVKIFIVMIILLSLIVFINNDEKYNIQDCAYLTLFSIMNVFVLSYIYQIRIEDINVIIYLLLITILTDTFAYLGGKLFGKHKLSKISPNKTVEGSITGSLFGTIIPSIFYIYMISPGENFIFIMLFSLLLSIIGQIGDLVFSSIKRHYKIKDFSNIMPGHGGILDRLDSIIFVVMGYIILINFI